MMLMFFIHCGWMCRLTFVSFVFKSGSTGVDPVARREIWQMVSDIVATEVQGVPKTSVILTTHSMDECEALCPRIGKTVPFSSCIILCTIWNVGLISVSLLLFAGIMANGKLRCLGSAQHLKSKFGKGFQLELKVSATAKDDDDYNTNLVSLARSKGGIADIEELSPESEIYFNLDQAQTALRLLTSDDYLSSMLNPTNPTGFGVHKDAVSPTGVFLSDLTSFVTNEIRMRDLGNFVGSAYASATLRERQDMKARFEVSSESVTISQIFASIEENKEKLRLSDYGGTCKWNLFCTDFLQ